MELKKLLSEFTDEELVQAAKKRKQDAFFHALGIGFMVGVAVYSLFRNGFGFLPVILIGAIAYIIYKKPNYKDVEEEINARKLR